MTEYNPLIHAPFMPITTEEKTGIAALQEKVAKREALSDKDINIVNIALKLLRQAFYDHSPYEPFICGEAGEKGKDGMPEFFFICPNYGLDGFATYKKDKDYSGPGW